MIRRAIWSQHTDAHSPTMYGEGDLNITQEDIQFGVDLLQTLFKEILMGEGDIMPRDYLVMVLNSPLNTLGYFGGYLVITFGAVIENDQAKKQECPLRGEG